MNVSEVDGLVIKSVPTYITAPCYQSMHSPERVAGVEQILVAMTYKVNREPPEATASGCTKDSGKVNVVRDQ